MPPVESARTNSRKFGASEAALGFIAYYLIIVFSALAISSLGAKFLPVGLGYDAVDMRIFIKIIGFLAGLVISGFFVFLLMKQYFIYPLNEVSLVKSSTWWCLIALCIGIVLSLTMKKLAYLDIEKMNVKKENPYEGLVNAGLLIKGLYVITTGLVAPFVEEFIFRGFLYRGFSQSWGKIIAAIVVSTLFVLIHTTMLQLGSSFVISILIVIAVLLLFVREISGSLIPSILLHQSYNIGLLFNS